MAGAYKGLLKGLRYITSMFTSQREPEMEIGGPTDVKHVAHIGWDGPTANAPSWMDKFDEGGGGGGGAGAGGGPLAEGEATEPQTKPRTTKGGKATRKKKKGAGGPSKASAKAKTATEDLPDNDGGE